VAVEFERGDEVANWRPLVNWLLAIPQLIVANALRSVEQVLGLLSLFFVLFTRRVPDSIVTFRVMAYRYQWRVMTFFLFMREEYPPFSFALTAEDDAIDAARLSIEPPGEMDRWKPLYKWFLAIPHVLVLAVLSVAAFFALIGAFLAVLFTGRFPRGIRDFVVGTARWGARVNAYVFFLTDVYPPFSLT